MTPDLLKGLNQHLTLEFRAQGQPAKKPKAKGMKKRTRATPGPATFWM